jgi:trk system potassium uptake protein TrkA
MAEIKQFVVLGLGTFGGALARKFHENGCRVTGIDASEEKVEEMKEFLYEAIIGDVTDPDTLRHLPIKDASAVFVALGEEITPSLLATLHSKELGASRVIAKGTTKEQQKILEKLGVERVVFAEEEIARELADRMTWPNVIDFLPIDPEYSILEMESPESLIDRQLVDADLRRRFGIWVIGVKDTQTGKLTMFPDGQFMFGEDQMLVVVGKQGDLDQLREMK